MILQDKHTKFATQNPNEWEYFQQNCKRYADNPPSTQYGIPKFGEEEKEENMIYGATPSEVRLKHIDHLIENPELTKDWV